MKAITETKKIATACAPPATVEWHQIDWVKVHGNVRRLQARIVKATKEGRWGKAKALQRLLTHSLSGKASAVKRVTENQGKRTPGVDGETWSTPKSKSQAIMSLRQRGYKPQPLKRVYIPKANGKKRPLGIPTMKDRAMQALYLLALDPIAETKADQSSFGFRKDRSCADAIEACFIALAPGRCAQWVLEGDIKGCFDNISHDWMIENIPMDKKILQKWLKAGFIEKKSLFPTEAGTPQGGIISPVLANMTLDGLEKLLKERFKPKDVRIKNSEGKTIHMQIKAKVNLVRYADDFIITGATKELLENKVKPLVGKFLATRGLILAEEKTRITHIEEGFDFLGQNIRKYKGKMIIKPAKKNVHKFLKGVRDFIKGNKALDQEKLIGKLNPIIKGWANYHQHVVAKETFRKVDHEIWKCLWRWAKRRHPKKGKQWTARKYWHGTGTRRWVFGQEDGKTLIRTTGIPIRRHVKIKGEANPYDPTWEEYFERRDGFKMERSLRGRRQLIALWRSQNGICPICNQRITRETGWHNHHIIKRCMGGPDGNSNRMLLHVDCHNRVHSQKLKVRKPADHKKG